MAVGRGSPGGPQGPRVSPSWVCPPCGTPRSRCRVNVGCGPAEQRLLLTGLHSVADIFCQSCKTTLGWKYVSAPLTCCRRCPGVPTPSMGIPGHSNPNCCPGHVLAPQSLSWADTVSPPGTGIREQPEVQGGEVHHRDVAHGEGERLGLTRGRSWDGGAPGGALGDPLLGTVPVPPGWHQPRGLGGFSRAIKAFFFRKVLVVTCPRRCHCPWLTLAHSLPQSGGPWWPQPVPSPPHTQEAGGDWWVLLGPRAGGETEAREEQGPPGALGSWGV